MVESSLHTIHCIPGPFLCYSAPHGNRKMQSNSLLCAISFRYKLSSYRLSYPILSLPYTVPYPSRSTAISVYVITESYVMAQQQQNTRFHSLTSQPTSQPGKSYTNEAGGGRQYSLYSTSPSVRWLSTSSSSSSTNDRPTDHRCTELYTTFSLCIPYTSRRCLAWSSSNSRTGAPPLECWLWVQVSLALLCTTFYEPSSNQQHNSLPRSTRFAYILQSLYYGNLAKEMSRGGIFNQKRRFLGASN